MNNVLKLLLEGEPLDIARMLRADDGRPRLAIVSIALLAWRHRRGMAPDDLPPTRETDPNV